MGLLPAIDTTQYEVSDDTWQALSAEITRVRGMIDSGAELQPNDVKNVRDLAKRVRQFGVTYRKAITAQSTAYKQEIDAELQKLGYTVIEEYIDLKKQEQQKAISDRLNEKLTKFSGIVDAQVAETKFLKNSPIASYVANDIGSRFPNLNSGAANKKITNWQVIESVVKLSVTKADEIYAQNPIMVQMPSTAMSNRAVSEYLTTGDVNKVDNIKDVLLEDRALVQQIVLKSRVSTDEATVDEIQKVLNTEDIDAKTKLERVKLLIDVRNTML